MKFAERLDQFSTEAVGKFVYGEPFQTPDGTTVITVVRAVVSVSAAALVAVIVYATLWLGYRQGWSWLESVDSSTLNFFYNVGLKNPSWVRFWDVLCTVLCPAAFRLLGVLAMVIVLARRQPAAVALFLLFSVELSGSVTAAAKGLADRPRPMTALVSSSSSSFPSGHALAAMVGVLALLAVSLPMLNRPTQLVVIALGALIVFAIGFARVALNVHHPSDVVAGWALGYLYFVVCLPLLRIRL